MMISASSLLWNARMPDQCPPPRVKTTMPWPLRLAVRRISLKRVIASLRYQSMFSKSTVLTLSDCSNWMSFLPCEILGLMIVIALSVSAGRGTPWSTRKWICSREMRARLCSGWLAANSAKFCSCSRCNEPVRRNQGRILVIRSWREPDQILVSP